MSKPVMTIIGFGPMGKKFTALFSTAFDVYVSSSRNLVGKVEELGATVVNDLDECLIKSDYVFLAIPVHALPGIVTRINDNANPDTIVVDCCSARLAAEKYLNNLNFQHYGLHELKTGEFCVIGNIDSHMKSFFQEKNIQLTGMSPEDHDRYNAIIGLGHFIGLSLEKHLADYQIDILGGIGSGGFLVRLMERLKGNTNTTYLETQIDNPFTEQIRKEFIKAMENYNRTLSKGNYPFT